MPCVFLAALGTERTKESTQKVHEDTYAVRGGRGNTEQKAENSNMRNSEVTPSSALNGEDKSHRKWA